MDRLLPFSPQIHPYFLHVFLIFAVCTCQIPVPPRDSSFPGALLRILISGYRRLQPVRHFSSDLCHQRGIFTQRSVSVWIVLSDDCCAKIPADQQFLKCSDQPHLAPKTMSLKITSLLSLSFISASLMLQSVANRKLIVSIPI